MATILYVEYDWVLISSETIQSEIMSPSNQDESLKLGNSPEREVEIEKAAIIF